MTHLEQRVLRFKVPATGITVHHFCGPGPILHVDARDLDSIEFWAVVELDIAEGPAGPARLFTVVGTGMPIPRGGIVHGTALSPEVGRAARGELVWHLVELTETSSL